MMLPENTSKGLNKLTNLKLEWNKLITLPANIQFIIRNQIPHFKSRIKICINIEVHSIAYSFQYQCSCSCIPILTLRRWSFSRNMDIKSYVECPGPDDYINSIQKQLHIFFIINIQHFVNPVQSNVCFCIWY